MSLEQGGSAAFYRRAGGAAPVRVGEGFSAGVSPDGRWVFLTPSSGGGTRLRAVPTGPGEPVTHEGLRIYPIGPRGGTSVEGATGNDLPVAWESSSRALFVWGREIPLRVFRVDLATAARTLALEVSPRDPSGVLYGHVRFTPDLSHYLFRFRRHSSYLAIVDGVR